MRVCSMLRTDIGVGQRADELLGEIQRVFAQLIEFALEIFRQVHARAHEHLFIGDGGHPPGFILLVHPLVDHRDRPDGAYPPPLPVSSPDSC